MKQKRLLYISTRVFWPPMGGHEVEMYHYCRGLHEKFGYMIDVYAFDAADKVKNIVQPEFLNKVYLAEDIGTTTKIKNIVFKSFLSGKRWPLQNSLYYSKANIERIEKLIGKENYDVVIVDMIRLATYYDALKSFDCKKILDIDDTLSKRYKRQLKKVTRKTDIAGQYHNKLPSVIRKLLGSAFFKKMVLKIEIPRIEKAENYYSELFDKVIFVSPIETDEFNKKYHTDKAVTVSLGVDYSYFSEDIPVEKVPGRVTFVGNMATPANADSVRFIIDEVIPKSKKIKEALFIGNCPESLLKEYESNQDVKFTGKVKDLRAEVKSGIVFLTPIAYGTGIKTKILEAMAMEMPVVTNTIGAEGISGVNGEHWYVSDEPDELAKYVDHLMESPSECEFIGKTSKQFVKEFFQWDIIFEQFNKLDL